LSGTGPRARGGIGVAKEKRGEKKQKTARGPTKLWKGKKRARR